VRLREDRATRVAGVVDDDGDRGVVHEAFQVN
jgi:hypothetical protein